MGVEPKSAADPRPNNEPYFIPKTCTKCGSKLVYADSLKTPVPSEDEFWYDEFECPKCRGGNYLDWPEETTKRLLEATKFPSC
jgi:predicted nucleic-acid-binding Zn-ribbon protein